jgi:Transglycosylase SLT domain
MPTGDPEDEARHKAAMGIGRRKGRWDDLLQKHADRTGLSVAELKRIVNIESGGDPGNRTGRYKGLFQLSDKEFATHGGGGNIYDPEQNIMAATNMLQKQNLAFKERTGRDMKPIDRYMVHQQGAAGYSAHLANPDEAAWKNVRKYYGSDEVAKKAIWGNIPDKDKKAFGSVENVTSAQFVNDVWAKRVEGGDAEFGGEAMAGGRYRGGRRSAAREESGAEIDTPDDLGPAKAKAKTFLSEPFEPISLDLGEIVPRFNLGRMKVP